MKGVSELLCLTVKRNQVDFQSAAGRLKSFKKLPVENQPSPKSKTLLMKFAFDFLFQVFSSDLCLISGKP